MLMKEERKFNVTIKNKHGYDRELQYYQEYAFVIIPGRGSKELKNVSEDAVKFYRNCGFEVDVKEQKEKLNEVPEELKQAKTLSNLNEVGIEGEQKGENKIHKTGELVFEVGIDQVKSGDNDRVRQAVEEKTPEELREFLVHCGVNVRNVKNKEKLLELAMAPGNKEKLEGYVK